MEKLILASKDTLGKDVLVNLMNNPAKKINPISRKSEKVSGYIIIPRIWMNAFNVKLEQKIKFDITEEGYLIVIPIRK